jgi:hypothetical protein
LVCVLQACTDDGDRAAEGTLQPVSENAPPANRFAEDFPAIASLDNADVWVACQQWDGRRDSIVAGLLTEWESEHRVDVYTSPTHIFGLTMAAGVGAEDASILHIVWSEQTQDGWALRSIEVLPDDSDGARGVSSGESKSEGAGVKPKEIRQLKGTQIGEPQTLVSAVHGNCTVPRLVSDSEGRLLLIWVAVHSEGLTLRARAYVPESGWGGVVDVAGDGPRDQWAPYPTVVAPGRFAVAWDAAVDGNFDIFFARLAIEGEGGSELRVTDRQRVTESSRYEAQPSIASISDRLYIAYEVGSENWGREGSVNKLDEALHISRQIEVVAVEGEGRSARVAPLAVPFMEGVSKSLRDGCEQPHLQVDGSGNLVMFFRGLTLPDQLHDPDNKQFQKHVEQRQGAGVGWRTSIWFSFMSRFDGTQWDIGGAHQKAVRASNGRSDAPIALGRLKQGGTAYAVVGDAREPQVVEAEGNEGQVLDLNWWGPISTESTLVSTGRLHKGQPVGPLPLGEASPMPPWPTPSDSLPGSPVEQESGGRSLQLALGDLHRHSDLSRCSGNWDGSFTEALRYGYDVGGLQFMAVTDHFEHMTRYDWWRSLAFMDQYDAPGRFVNFRAYERADAQTGHRNVISGSEILPIVAYRKEFLEGRDDASANSPDALWQHFAGEQLMTIPHTPAGMYEKSGSVFDWLSFNPEYDRVVEIFQSYRGSSEEFEGPRSIPSLYPKRFAQPNLDGGLHFGFIASSDHQSTYGAFAGAWTTGVSRGEVFEALHARRTFASTVRMSLWVEWDGVPLGEIRSEPPSDGGKLTVDASLEEGEFGLLEVIVDGVVVQSRAVSGSSLSETFEGLELSVPEEGTRYVYVRVRTADGELGWSSPIRRGPGAALPDGPLGVDAYDDVSGPALQGQFKSSAKWRGDVLHEH